MSDFMKIRPVRSDFFLCEREDGQTERHYEAHSNFSQLCERA